MQRHAAAALLVLASATQLLSQLGLQPQPQGLLLEVAGHPVDVLGRLRGLGQRLVRRCGAVQDWPAGSDRWREVQHTLAGYSPPVSDHAAPLQVLGVGDGDAEWLLAEVTWPRAGLPGLATTTPAAAPAGPAAPVPDPAIVPLRRVAGRLQVQAGGVWSGDTGLWWPPVVIRRYLADQVPELPTALRQCLDAKLPQFGGH